MDSAASITNPPAMPVTLKQADAAALLLQLEEVTHTTCNISQLVLDSMIL
jgi:hypothetical protein